MAIHKITHTIDREGGVDNSYEWEKIGEGK
jgi:hypothetical protein